MMFDGAPGTVVWTGLSLAIGFAATLLWLAWAEGVTPRKPAARAGRWLGAGLSLGTGLWAIHGITAMLVPGLAGAGFSALGEAGLWVLGCAAGMAVPAGPNARRAGLGQRFAPAAAAATGAVAVLVLGTLVAARSPAALEWHGLVVLVAWAACAALFAAALGLCHAARRRDAATPTHVRASAALLGGIGLVLAQQGVLRATGAPALGAPPGATDIPGSALAALALLGSTGVLLVSKQLLQRRSRAQAALDAARRENAAAPLNDPLTRLPTRQLFDGALAQAVRAADAGNERLALLLVNLDGFKPINQSFGHRGGDRVLREVASRLRALAQPHGVARMGGDEFLMLLSGDPQPDAASALAARVIASIGAPFTGEGREAAISCSVGVVMYPEHGAKSTMIVHAHAAMTAAKAAGGASHAFFEPRMMKGPRDDIELLRDLRGALERRELELCYQPKIHAPSGEVTGAEALLRWHHPQRGMVSPVVFIPIAERYGLINAMGRWVIDEACRQARAWRDTGLRMRVAINLSVHQLRQPDLAEWITAALQRHQINPDLLTCEITESSAMDDIEMTMRVLGQLDRVGVHLSIDDFGTGHSSLAWLRKLPADELKIDRSFVMDLETSEDARKVALAVINLAKALDLKVVAEGVETEGQNRILRDFGCDQLQGYLFAKPMSAKALALWAMNDVGPRTLNFRESLFKETAPMVQA